MTAVHKAVHNIVSPTAADGKINQIGSRFGLATITYLLTYIVEEPGVRSE